MAFKRLYLDGAPPKSIFEHEYNNIYANFGRGRTIDEIAEIYGVNRATAHEWRQHWIAALELLEDPPEIIKLKNEVHKSAVVRTKDAINKEELAIRESILKNGLADVTQLKINSLRALHLAVDRLMVLIPNEKSSRNLAAVVNALMPYVTTKMDDGKEKPIPLDQKRQMFIQQVYNTYNNVQVNNSLTTEEHGQIISDSGDGDSAE